MLVSINSEFYLCTNINDALYKVASIAALYLAAHLNWHLTKSSLFFSKSLTYYCLP